MFVSSSLHNIFIQIPPIGIHFFDQFQLPVPFPILQLLLTGDGGFDFVIRFIIHQHMNPMFFRKVTAFAFFMFPTPPYQIIRDTKIQSLILTAGEDVDEAALA